MRSHLSISLALVIGLLGLGACTEGTSLATTEPPPGSATVTDVAVTPSRATIEVGSTVRLSARVTTVDDRTPPAVAWRSKSPTVADVNDDGLVSSVAPGSAWVVAQAGTIVDSAEIIVAPAPPAPVASVTVMPAAVSAVVGASVQLAAVTKDAAGNTLTGRVVTWSTNASTIATVSSSGVVSAVAAGSASITATSEGRSASSAVTITTLAAPVASVSVTPASASVQIGQTLQLTATPKDANGTSLGGRVITWASSNPAAATVNGSGLVTGAGTGSATITATSEGQSGTSTITMTSPPAPVASVEVTPGTASIVTGQNVQLTATPKDGSGAALTGRAMTWASSNTSVATVSTNGLVTGRGVGSATITATSEGKSGTAAITATLVPVATVSVSPGSANLETGRTVQLSATLRDAAGATLSGRTVTWASSNTSVATVAANGTVSALTVGSATITATSEGKTGSAAVTVEAAPPPPPPPPPGSSNGIWMSAAQIQALPASGPAWDNLKRAADNDLSDGVLSTRDEHNVRTMAAGLVAARLNSDTYRAKVRESLRGLMANAISGSDPLAIVRRLGTYAIAADLIDLKTFDPAFDQLFRAWLDKTRKTEFGGETVAEIHERRPNNWGTHAGISRIAVAIYLGDRTDLERAALVYKGWLGDRTAYAGFTYNEVEWWQADPSKPVGINPKGATRDGHSIDGVLPDDQRRAGGFTWPPQKENYIYTALEGALGEAVLLSHQGYDVWNWSDRALLRAFNWLHEQANYPAEGNDCWQPYIINKAYGTSFPAPASSSPGKNIGWADWTHQR